MDEAIHPVLLCGGSGTRLWPLSRQSYPKQFARLTGPESLFQATARRLSGPGFAAPLAVTGDPFRFIVTEQLAAARIAPRAVLIDPEGRNTAHAVMAADQMDLVEAPAPQPHDLVHIGIALARIQRGRFFQEQGQARGGGVQCDEVRREHQDAAALVQQRLQMVFAAQFHRVRDAFGRAEPAQAPVHEGLGQQAEMAARQGVPVGRGQIGKATFQVHPDDVGARAQQTRRQPPQDTPPAQPRAGGTAAEMAQDGAQQGFLIEGHGREIGKGGRRPCVQPGSWGAGAGSSGRGGGGASPGSL